MEINKITTHFSFIFPLQREELCLYIKIRLLQVGIDSLKAYRVSLKELKSRADLDFKIRQERTTEDKKEYEKNQANKRSFEIPHCSHWTAI